VAAVVRVTPLEHPVPNKKQSASPVPNKAKRIGNVRDWLRVREREKQDLPNFRVKFRLSSSKEWQSQAEFRHPMLSKTIARITRGERQVEKDFELTGTLKAYQVSPLSCQNAPGVSQNPAGWR
jgi:hypothetical protein